MAVKKSELYSSLWASCDNLRGGMDSSQYKDYILTLLFVKYVSDKFKGVAYGDIDVPEGGSFDDMLALIGTKNIGEEMDKIIARLAEANNLRGVIDNAHFNDEDKLGKGKEMVDKLSELLGIFRDQMPDFSRNRADGDDIIGDAYEYLMRNFATESGKSKGQFYTPAEVSRILAKVVGIEHATGSDTTLYDPACGSGSLLIRAAEAAPVDVAIYGQEKEGTTAGLARMNLVLHNRATAEIKGGYSTFSDPQYKSHSDDSVLRQFDFAVVNPPFSDKNWTHGLKEFGRFDGYGDHPPQKNGDFAWLLHIIKSLNRNGKAAVILPHGVLFRGNAEATIRQSLIDRGFIKGIIGLPANLFYGTGIPACIIVIDKENADERDGILMIDASRDFIKDGNKNRLRERDVYKITTVFNERIVDDPKYARFVPNSEIKDKNSYNLNIPRYIDSGVAEDLQSIDGHLNGGIPSDDVGSLSLYWKTFPNLQATSFSPMREGFYSLAVDKDTIRDTINNDADFSAYADKVEGAFNKWKTLVDGKLRAIDGSTKPKLLIVEIADLILKEYERVTLIDKYDAYEVLLSYWNEVMSDDVYLLVQDGYKAIRDIEVFKKTTVKKKKDGTETKQEKETGWDGKLVPKALVIEMYFAAEQKAIDELENIIAVAQTELDEMTESAEDSSAINDVLSDKGKVKKAELKAKIEEIRSYIVNDEISALLQLLAASLPKKKEVADFIQENPLCKNVVTDNGTITATSIKNRIAEIRQTVEVPELHADEYEDLIALQEKQTLVDESNKVLKELRTALDKKTRDQYPKLTDAEGLTLLLERKWYRSLVGGIFALYDGVSHRISDRVTELVERYEHTLPELETKVAGLESKVKSHLEIMGFVW
jgi:type I restriction enzyme M protein